MSKKRFIDTSFWSDVWVVDELNPLDRYLFLYLLTNERTNIAGIYEISLRTMSYETGIEREEIIRMLKRLDSRVVYESGWIVLRNAIKNQNYRSPKIKAGIEITLAQVPDKTLIWINEPRDWIPAVVKNATERLLLKSDTVSIPNDTVYMLNDSNRDLIINKDIDTSVSISPSAPAKPKVATKDITHLFDYWEEIVGFRITSDLKKQRKYASDLIKENPIPAIEKMINGVAMASKDQFAPRISNFRQLYYKWDELKGWGQRTMSKQASGGKIAKI